MMAVVDTNVPVVANGNSGQASDDCVVSCAKKLQSVMDTGQIVLDDQWLIIEEYQNNLRSIGQPGPGDAFLKWVLTNRSNRVKCLLVSIHPTGPDGSSFEEFPLDPALQDFDAQDRKFVAVARACSPSPVVLEAVDPGWWIHRRALEECGLQIEFLCQSDIKKLAGE